MAHAIFGALFITVLSNGMDILQVNGYVQQIMLGTILVVGLSFDRLHRGSASQ